MYCVFYQQMAVFPLVVFMGILSANCGLSKQYNVSISFGAGSVGWVAGKASGL